MKRKYLFTYELYNISTREIAHKGNAIVNLDGKLDVQAIEDFKNRRSDVATVITFIQQLED